MKPELAEFTLSEGGAEQEVAHGVAPLDLSNPIASGAATLSESVTALPEQSQMEDL